MKKNGVRWLLPVLILALSIGCSVTPESSTSVPTGTAKRPTVIPTVSSGLVGSWQSIRFEGEDAIKMRDLDKQKIIFRFSERKSFQQKVFFDGAERSSEQGQYQVDGSLVRLNGQYDQKNIMVEFVSNNEMLVVPMRDGEEGKLIVRLKRIN